VVNVKRFRPAFLLLFAMIVVFMSHPSVLSSQIDFQSGETLPSIMGTEEEGKVYITTIEPIADTYVDEKWYWKNFGHNDILAVWAYGDKYVSFIKFDLSSIPSSANIVSAELFLRVAEYSVDSNNPSIIGAHFYSNNSWGEYDLSWDTVDWSALKETATDTTEIYVDKLERQVWFNWTITEDVENAKSNLLTVVLIAENRIESIFFYSRETSLKPHLNIILQDNMPPTTSHDYDGAWHTSDFTITLSAVDNESGIAETYYRINQGTVKAVSTDDQPRITTEEANNTLEYWSVDKVGNEESPHNVLMGIKLDKTPPTGFIVIDDEANYTTTVSVGLTLRAEDATSGVVEMRFSNDSITYTEWQAYAISQSWTLQEGD